MVDRDDKTIKSYLLGELDDTRRLTVEQQIMIDDDQFEELLVAGDELADAYVTDSLSRTEREHYEKLLLSTPLGRQNLRFTEALHRYVDRNRELSSRPENAGNPFLKSFDRLGDILTETLRIRGYVAGILLFSVASLGFGLGYKIDSPGKQSDLSRLEALQTPASNPELVRQLDDLRIEKERLEIELHTNLAIMAQNRLSLPAPDSSAPTAFFILMPGSATRSSSRDAGKEIKIPSDARGVTFQLELENNQYPTYRATLLTRGGTMIRRIHGLLPQSQNEGQSLTVRLPARMLQGGAYVIELEGFTAGNQFEKADRFYFSVTDH